MSITRNEHKYLRDKMIDLLDEYDYMWNLYALDKIIDTWAANKATLIEAFKRHPNYVEGKFMIAFDVDYSREIDKCESYLFSSYLSELIGKFKNDIPEEMIAKREEEKCLLLPSRLFNFLTCLGDYATRTLSECDAEMLDEVCPNAHVHAGMKTSRAVNKICTYLGYNKDEEYNKRFARYADSLSPLKIKRHTILSINPLDYLTMSFGNSWASCHTIDKQNIRNMPNSYQGQYSSGTVSYMLDEPSMVFYTIDSSYEGDEYFTQPKIVRQMYHYAEDKLVQGRLYPQCNDYGSNDSYEDYRAIVQKIISEIFNFPNRWTVKHGTNAIEQYVYTEGTHYPDYENFSNCTLSRPRDNENEECFTIGHFPICIECGEEHSDSEYINCCHDNSHYHCTNCGYSIAEDDVIWINGEPYCSDCANYCDHCEEWVLGETTYIESTGEYVCECCLENDFTYCDICGYYEDNYNVTYIPSEDIAVCESCYNEYFSRCNGCGEPIRDENLYELDGNWYCEECYKNELSKRENEEVAEAC